MNGFFKYFKKSNGMAGEPVKTLDHGRFALRKRLKNCSGN